MNAQNQITNHYNSLKSQQKEKSILYIFSCLQATYGNNWRNQFKSGINDADGVDTGIKNAQKFWLQKLDFFLNSQDGRQAVKQALDNLPLRPPNLIEFYESVKHFWTQIDIKRESDMRLKQLQSSVKLTPEQQNEQNIRVKEIMENLKNLFSQRAKMFD